MNPDFRLVTAGKNSRSWQWSIPKKYAELLKIKQGEMAMVKVDVKKRILTYDLGAKQ